MKEWLTVIVVFLIVGILLDGWRRMRIARKDNIRVSRRSRSFDSSVSEADDSPYTSELPNGGARVIAKREVEDTVAPKVERKTAQAATAREPASSIPQQVSLNLDESVPMLMESVESAHKQAPAANAAQSHETGAQQPDLNHAAAATEKSQAHTHQPSFTTDFEEPHDNRLEPSFSAFDDDAIDTATGNEPTPAIEESDQDSDAQPDEVIIINVMAPEGTRFAGEHLLDALIQTGMRFGEMEIFHRHTSDNGEGAVQFSLANMVHPGTFDLDRMAEFSTPGVSMFLTLPMRADSIKAFDTMRETAQFIASSLGGELKDEQRSIMTRQTMEHCRQRIADYERKRLSRAGH